MIYQATDAMFLGVLAVLAARFDSHQFIFEFRRMFPREYGMDLGALSSGRDPERTLHSLYAKRLRKFSGLTAVQKVWSLNVRGGRTRNQGWQQ